MSKQTEWPVQFPFNATAGLCVNKVVLPALNELNERLRALEDRQPPDIWTCAKCGHSRAFYWREKHAQYACVKGGVCSPGCDHDWVWLSYAKDVYGNADDQHDAWVHRCTRCAASRRGEGPRGSWPDARGHVGMAAPSRR